MNAAQLFLFAVGQISIGEAFILLGVGLVWIAVKRAGKPSG